MIRMGSSVRRWMNSLTPPQAARGAAAAAGGGDHTTATVGAATTASSSCRPVQDGGSCVGDDAEEARAFIVARGYTAPVADGIVDTLLKTGMTADTVKGTVISLAGAYEMGNDAGLEAMAKAVEQEVAKVEGKALVRVVVKPPGRGAEFELRGYEGWSLKDVAEHGEDDGARLLGEFLECACDGVMACSTCQVVVDPAWFDRVGEPGEAEMDMLDLAYNPQDTSRLGCQVVLSPALNGLRLRLPAGANNLFDHIPFE